ncbi:unnamed protein product [Durusdinium trenchii]|uniref:Uncharacterized protein n=1 Tax=Durusdinium trenchii TaxID=1381693 RepID=A0ABP0NLB6_9DINO
MAPYWYETFGPAAGQALAFETFNLYHANNWIILPSTQGRGGRDAWGCSYVELVSREAEAQRPQWFVSHAWKEPIVNFVACLRKHLTVCAYANNQHRVDEEIPEDPRESAFFRAMKVSDGVLLILDTHHGFSAVEERDSSGALLLDLATASADAKDASLVTDGLAGVETQMMPLLGMLAKSQREASFPAEIMQRGLEVLQVHAPYNYCMTRTEMDNLRVIHLRYNAIDKFNKYNWENGWIWLRGHTIHVRTMLTIPEDSPHHTIFGMALAHLGQFGQSQLPPEVQLALGVYKVDIKQAQAAVAEDKNRILNSIVSRHPDAVSRGRQMVQLSMTGCFSFKDSDLQSLVQCLPEKLRVLRLDLAFTGLDSPFDGSLEFPSSLEQLVLRFAGSLQSVEGLPAMLFSFETEPLGTLALQLASFKHHWPLGRCDQEISSRRVGTAAEWLSAAIFGHQRRPVPCPDLPPHVAHVVPLPVCPSVWSRRCLTPRTPVRHRSLQDVLLWARVKRHVHIEDVSSAWSCLRRRADAVPERTLTVEDPSQSFCSDTEIEMMLPYPCSQAGCKEFHPNEHGFCSRHRHSRFFWKVRPTLRLAWQAGELALLFSIQALFEARSRFVLVFFGLSLYPVLCMMMADSMGLSFGLTFSTTLLVVLASMAYTSGRFDSMRGAMQRLCLAMEASYFQVRKPKLLWVRAEITATCEAFVFVMRQRKEEELSWINMHSGS